MNLNKLTFLGLITWTVIVCGGVYFLSAVLLIVFGQYPASETLQVAGEFSAIMFFPTLALMWAMFNFKPRNIT